MKISIVLLMFITLFFPLSATEQQAFTISIEPHWQDLDCNNCEHAERFGGKWILVGSITFKKKAKDPIHLTRLYLHWNGTPLDTLSASLYRDVNSEKFLPIEEFLMCDGTWNKATQTLALHFEKEESLGLENTFHLVLTIPNHLESTIRHGTFTIVKNRLPDPFRIAMDTHALSLALDIT